MRKKQKIENHTNCKKKIRKIKKKKKKIQEFTKK